MKFSVGAASFLALALFVAPVVAQANRANTNPAAAPAAGALEQIALAIPNEVQALLADTRPDSALSDDELKLRFSTARQFSGDASLPINLRQKLGFIGRDARAELLKRQQKQAAPQVAPAPAPPPKAQVQTQVAPPPPNPPAAAAPIAQQKVVQPLPSEVQSLLADTRPDSALSDDELKSRFLAARQFSGDPSLPINLRQKLGFIGRDARAELLKREKQQTAPKAADKPVVPVVPATPAIVQTAPPPPAAKPVVQTPPPAAPAVAAAAAIVAGAVVLDAGTGDPAAEKQAHIYLDDKTDITKISDDDLRKRLDGVRDMMATSELSRDTERAVRAKLKAERDVLRGRLAQAEAKLQQQQAQANQAAPPPPVAPAQGNAKPVPPPPPPPKGLAPAPAVSGAVITSVTPPQQVLRDTRPSENLNVSELQIRIQVFVNAQTNPDYDAANRDYWRASVARDREILRRRMIMERQRRQAELDNEYANDNIDINIGPDYAPSRRPPAHDVFAAEIDNREMEDVLAAPPRIGIQQRYSLNDIATQPDLRHAVSRIEIDTIHFGFRESFLREEQLSYLDGIAAIIERIVRKYPNEVFLIEGHTDAVGSDAANLKLSKLRAESVKRALVHYYVIPARNLRTVGLGAHFLKIPTGEPEAENRRVSIARITPLLGSNY